MKHVPASEALSMVFLVAALAFMTMTVFNHGEQRRETRPLATAAAQHDVLPELRARRSAGSNEHDGRTTIGVALTTIAYESQLAEQQPEKGE